MPDLERRAVIQTLATSVLFPAVAFGNRSPALGQAPGYSMPKPVPIPETVVELDKGETANVTLTDGTSVRLKLVAVREIRDTINGAIRRVHVRVEIDGQPLELVSGDYSLPVAFGNVQIDVPSTFGYITGSSPYPNGLINYWGMKKEVRFRLWPKGSPLTTPGTYVYPVKQKFLASASQMCNEPVHVGGSDCPGLEDCYYHYGLDFGGSEGDVDVVAVADGLIVSAADRTLPEFDKGPVVTHIDGVWLFDGRGWFHRYSHLNKIFVKPGDTVKAGQTIGKLGKEGPAGYSGGWSHLHYGLLANPCTGLWGDAQAYPYVWEAYWNQYRPELIAVARPHQVAAVGEKIVLSGVHSKARSGDIVDWEWTLSNGTKASGKRVEMVYDQPGAWSEILKVTDSKGNVAYDAVLSIVYTKEMIAKRIKVPKGSVPRIRLAYFPTFGIKVGQEVTFKVRSSWTDGWGERVDFGDGTPPASLRSDGNRDAINPDGYDVCKHSYAKPGTYIVHAEHVNAGGVKANMHVFVTVE